MTKVYNKSRETVEQANQAKCPRCSGFGGVSGDAHNCPLCNGWGRLWVSLTGSGWTRALWARIENSQLW